MRPLKSDYRPGAPATQVACDWFNTVARVINAIWDWQADQLYLIASRESSFAWKCTGIGTDTLTIAPGGVEIGADAFIPWDDIADTETSIPVSGTEWHVVLDVDVRDSIADADKCTLRSGSSITALTSEERKYTMRKKICDVSLSLGVIASINQLQCGNVSISRL